MRSLYRPLAAAALVAAAFATPGTAHAQNCVGIQSIFYACTNVPSAGVGSWEQCVYTGGDTCKNVSVPFPTLGSEEIYVYCKGDLAESLDEAGVC